MGKFEHAVVQMPGQATVDPVKLTFGVVNAIENVYSPEADCGLNWVLTDVRRIYPSQPVKEWFILQDIHANGEGGLAGVRMELVFDTVKYNSQNTSTNLYREGLEQAWRNNEALAVHVVFVATSQHAKFIVQLRLNP